MAKNMPRITRSALTAVLACAVAAPTTSCSQNFSKAQTGEQQEQQANKITLVRRLEDLDNRTADHSTPDAIVYIAPGYDWRSPINLIIFNHGMMTNLEDVEQTWKISQAVQAAPPNTVLIAPEWAQDPKALSSKAGRFHQPGFFRNMLYEIFSKVPELKDRSIDRDVSQITLASFSGGLYALATELEKNGIKHKVKSIALFDSLYKTGVLDGWLKENVKALASGEKQFYNFYFHTYPRSIPQAKLIKSLLTANGIDPSQCMRWDTDSPNTVMSARRIASRPIVFKYCIHSNENLTGHNAVPMYYVPQLMKAMTLKQQEAMLSAKPEQAL